MRDLFPILLVVFVCLALALAVGVGVMMWTSGVSGRTVGTVLIYEIEPSHEGDLASLRPKLVEAINRRVNTGWGRRADVRLLDDGRLEIGVFGNEPKMVQRMERLLKYSGTLEFRILANRRDHEELIEQAVEEDSDQLRSESGKLLAWWVPVEQNQKQSFEHYMHGDDGRVLPESSREIAIRERQRRGIATYEVLVVKDPFDVTGLHLSSSRVGWDARGQPCVNFTFDSTGGRLFGGITTANLPDPVSGFRRQLGIILDGYLYSAPGIRSTIYDRGEITGTFTQQEVEDLVSVFNSGSLPAPIRQVEKRAADQTR